MKTSKYSTKQIKESIKHWKKLLEACEAEEIKKNPLLSEKFIEEVEEIDEAKMTREQYDELQQKLQTGIVKFKFIKKDRSERIAIGTLNPSLMPDEATQRQIYANLTDQQGNPITYDQLMQRLHDRVSYMPYFWDLENNGYRQFHVSRFVEILGFRQTSQQADVRRISNANFFSGNNSQDNLSRTQLEVLERIMTTISSAANIETDDYRVIEGMITDLILNPVQ